MFGRADDSLRRPLVQPESTKMAPDNCSVAVGLSAVHKFATATRDAALIAYPVSVIHPVVKEFAPRRRATRRDAGAFGHGTIPKREQWMSGPCVGID